MMSSKLILVLQGVGTGWRVGEHGLFGAHESEDIRTIWKAFYLIKLSQ